MAEFEAQRAESIEHAQDFRKAAHNFGLLTSIERHHARQYTDALSTLDGKTVVKKAPSDNPNYSKMDLSSMFDDLRSSLVTPIRELLLARLLLPFQMIGIVQSAVQRKNSLSPMKNLLLPKKMKQAIEGRTSQDTDL